MNTRLIFVTGDKGGVGKTTIARIIADYLEKSESKVSYFDTDKTNATFKRFIGESCKLLDIDQKGTLDELIDDVIALTTGTQCVIDCAARSLDVILEWMDEIEFENIIKETSLNVAFFFVLGSDKDSLQILSDLFDDMESFGLNPQYFIVKNMGRSSDYSQYENSQTKVKLKSSGALELVIPELLERTCLAMDKSNIRFTHLDDFGSDKLSITDKQRTKSFIRKSFESIEAVNL